MWKRRTCNGALFALTLSLGPVHAQDFVRQELRIPTELAGRGGLEALLVRPNGPGRYPLALISHGSPRVAADRREMTPLGFVPHATEFARRGWAAAVVLRRGFGDSAGNFTEGSGPCNNPDYLRSATVSALDLRAAITALSKRPEVDASRILAVGVSAGGLASIALAARPMPGLAAVISFAGGRGSPKPDTVCREDRLIEAFGALGKASRVPMLWVYAENDHFFSPALAVKLRRAFTGAGAKLDVVMAAPFREDGHELFSTGGIPIWTPMVDDFLKKQNLVVRSDLLPLPHPPVEPPKELSAGGRQAFAEFVASGPHKAFAVSPRGAYGWRAGRRGIERAKADALATCKKFAEDCRVVVVNDDPVR